jgi:hypothetical protein
VVCEGINETKWVETVVGAGIASLRCGSVCIWVIASCVQVVPSVLAECRRLNPQYAVAYYNRGFAYGNLGKRVESERDIQKAKELGYSP